jgi:hypothetical protein
MNQFKSMGMQPNPMLNTAAPMARPAMSPAAAPSGGMGGGGSMGGGYNTGIVPPQAPAAPTFRNPIMGWSGAPAAAAPTYRNPLSGAVAPGPMSGGMMNTPGAPQMQGGGFLQNILQAIRNRRAPTNPRSWNATVMPEGAEQFTPQSGLQAISNMPLAKPLLDQFKL